MKKTYHYRWHDDEKDGCYYNTPRLCALCKKEDGAWKWCIFNPGGFLIASEYQLASKQNAQRNAVEYITKWEKDNA